MTVKDLSHLQGTIRTTTVDLRTGAVEGRYTEMEIGGDFYRKFLIPATEKMRERETDGAYVRDGGWSIYFQKKIVRGAGEKKLLMWRVTVSEPRIAEDLEQAIADRVTAAFFIYGATRLEIARDRNERGNLVLLIDEPM